MEVVTLPNQNWVSLIRHRKVLLDVTTSFIPDCWDSLQLLKELCQLRIIMQFFKIMPLERPCSLNFAGLQKLLVIGKITVSCQANMSPKQYIVTNNNELWKPLRLTRFQNHHCDPFQSSLSFSIRVSFCICCVTCVYQFVSFFEKLRICIYLLHITRLHL